MPHIDGKFLTNVIRKDTTHLWVKYDLISGRIAEYRYPSKKDVNKCEQSNRTSWTHYIDPILDDPANNGYILVPVEWKEVGPVRLGLKFTDVYATNERTVHYTLTAVDDSQSFIMAEEDFTKMMKSVSVINGVFLEDWCFYRAGTVEYRIRPAWLNPK